jgi:hypothetical protein
MFSTPRVELLTWTSLGCLGWRLGRLRWVGSGWVGKVEREAAACRHQVARTATAAAANVGVDPYNSPLSATHQHAQRAQRAALFISQLEPHDPRHQPVAAKVADLICVVARWSIGSAAF